MRWCRSAWPIAQAEPATARALLWEFLALGESVFGRCDDRSGLMGDVFRHACRQLGLRPEPSITP